MSKGGYFGGSTILGFSGSFTGARGKKLTRATDADAHLTQKADRNAAREVAGKTKKKPIPQVSKGERRAENEARKRYRESSKGVIVDRIIDGVIVSTKTIQRS